MNYNDLKKCPSARHLACFLLAVGTGLCAVCKWHTLECHIDYTLGWGVFALIFISESNKSSNTITAEWRPSDGIHVDATSAGWIGVITLSDDRCGNHFSFYCTVYTAVIITLLLYFIKPTFIVTIHSFSKNMFSCHCSVSFFLCATYISLELVCNLITDPVSLEWVKPSLTHIGDVVASEKAIKNVINVYYQQTAAEQRSFKGRW